MHQNHDPHSARTTKHRSPSTDATPASCDQPAATRETPGDRAAIERLRRMFEAEAELILALIEPGGDARLPNIRTVLSAAIEAATANPDFADLHYYAARAAVAAGKDREADELAGRAVEINPRYHDALILLARIARKAGATCRAVALLRQALEAGADYADVHLMLGDACRERDDQAEAERAYRRALEINTNMTAARTGLAAVGDCRRSRVPGGESVLAEGRGQ